MESMWRVCSFFKLHVFLHSSCCLIIYQNQGGYQVEVWSNKSEQAMANVKLSKCPLEDAYMYG